MCKLKKIRENEFFRDILVVKNVMNILNMKKMLHYLNNINIIFIVLYVLIVKNNYPMNRFIWMKNFN
jgi:hypothetical protein